MEWGQRSRPQLEKKSKMREGKPPEAQNGAAHALRELTKNVYGESFTEELIGDGMLGAGGKGC